jgi:hypothetical protein
MEASYENMSSARLGLALCLHNKKRSRNSIFHLLKEIRTVAENEVVTMDPDRPRCYHCDFHETAMGEMSFAIFNHLYHW